MKGLKVLLISKLERKGNNLKFLNYHVTFWVIPIHLKSEPISNLIQLQVDHWKSTKEVVVKYKVLQET